MLNIICSFGFNCIQFISFYIDNAIFRYREFDIFLLNRMCNYETFCNPYAQSQIFSNSQTFNDAVRLNTINNWNRDWNDWNLAKYSIFEHNFNLYISNQARIPYLLPKFSECSSTYIINDLCFQFDFILDKINLYENKHKKFIQLHKEYCRCFKINFNFNYMFRIFIYEFYFSFDHIYAGGSNIFSYFNFLNQYNGGVGEKLLELKKSFNEDICFLNLQGYTVSEFNLPITEDFGLKAVELIDKTYLDRRNRVNSFKTYFLRENPSFYQTYKYSLKTKNFNIGNMEIFHKISNVNDKDFKMPDRILYIENQQIKFVKIHSIM